MEEQRLIDILKVLLNIDDIEIIKYVIESIIEEIEERKESLKKED
jgi:hypothetical protein